MWEKLSDYCLDISKYFLTAVFVTALMGDLEANLHWIIYIVSGTLGLLFLVAGIFFSYKNKKEKEQKRNKYRRFHNKKRRT